MRFFRWLVFAHLLGCFGDRAGAQQFNIRVDPHGLAGQASTAWSIEPSMDGGFMVIAAADFSDSMYYSSVVTSILLDQAGDTLGVHRYAYPGYATYPGWSNSTARRADGGFTVGGNTFTIDDQGDWISRAALFQVSASGAFERLDTIGPDSGSWIGRQAKQTPDGGFMIYGETTVGGEQSDAFLIKTDAQGEEEWAATYGGAFLDFAVAVDNRFGGGVLFGWRTRFVSGQYRPVRNSAGWSGRRDLGTGVGERIR